MKYITAIRLPVKVKRLLDVCPLKKFKAKKVLSPGLQLTCERSHHVRATGFAAAFSIR